MGASATVAGVAADESVPAGAADFAGAVAAVGEAGGDTLSTVAAGPAGAAQPTGRGTTGAATSARGDT